MQVKYVFLESDQLNISCYKHSCCEAVCLISKSQESSTHSMSLRPTFIVTCNQKSHTTTACSVCCHKCHCTQEVQMAMKRVSPHSHYGQFSLFWVAAVIILLSLHYNRLAFFLASAPVPRWEKGGFRERLLFPSLQKGPQLREVYELPRSPFYGSCFKVGVPCQPQALLANDLAHFPGTWEGCHTGEE